MTIKFRVVARGRHFRLLVIKRKWLWRKEQSSKEVGFYSTRFVEAQNANEARDKVLEKLRIELDKEGRSTEGSIIELEQIQEDETGFDLYAPGEGYTFYSEYGSMPD